MKTNETVAQPQKENSDKEIKRPEGDTFLKDVDEAGKKVDVPAASEIRNEATEENKEPFALAQQNGNGLPLTPVDMNAGALPDLDDAEIVPLDLSSTYWSPTVAGDSKRVYFDTIKQVQYRDSKDEDVVIDLVTAFFFENSKGQTKAYSNASKGLIAIFERNHIERGTPILITYLGKIKNSTNSFMRDNWSVKPLMIKIK